MRRCILAVPALAILALTGCIVTPPPLPGPDPQPQPTPDVITQPSPDVTTPPTPEVTEEQSGTEDVPTPDETIDPITAGGQEGSAGNPYPAGSDLVGGGWTVIVDEIDLEAEQAAIDGFRSAAPDGWQWVAARIRVSTDATDGNTADAFLSFVAANGDVYYSEIVFGSDAQAYEDMTQGQEYTFREYLLVPRAELATGVLAITTDGLTSFIAMP